MDTLVHNHQQQEPQHQATDSTSAAASKVSHSRRYFLLSFVLWCCICCLVSIISYCWVDVVSLLPWWNCRAAGAVPDRDNIAVYSDIVSRANVDAACVTWRLQFCFVIRYVITVHQFGPLLKCCWCFSFHWVNWSFTVVYWTLYLSYMYSEVTLHSCWSRQCVLNADRCCCCCCDEGTVASLQAVNQQYACRLWWATDRRTSRHLAGPWTSSWSELRWQSVFFWLFLVSLLRRCYMVYFIVFVSICSSLNVVFGCDLFGCGLSYAAS